MNKVKKNISIEVWVKFKKEQLGMKLYPRLPGINVSLMRLPGLAWNSQFNRLSLLKHHVGDGDGRLAGGEGDLGTAVQCCVAALGLSLSGLLSPLSSLVCHL